MEHHDLDQDRVALLHHDRYTVEELAIVLNMDRRRIEQAVFNGALDAEVLNHQIVAITRANAIRWLAAGSATGGE